MRAKRSARYNIIRGGLLAGALFSFVPAFALVKGNANGAADGGDDNAGVSQTTNSSRGGDANTRSGSSSAQPYQQSQTSSGQSIAPSQTRPSTTQIQPRARTRAS